MLNDEIFSDNNWPGVKLSYSAGLLNSFFYVRLYDIQARAYDLCCAQDTTRREKIEVKVVSKVRFFWCANPLEIGRVWQKVQQNAALWKEKKTHSAWVNKLTRSMKLVKKEVRRRFRRSNLTEHTCKHTHTHTQRREHVRMRWDYYFMHSHMDSQWLKGQYWEMDPIFVPVKRPT